jgi:Holliday junction resolvasome RuvABC DNA-binding subunit
MVNLAGYREALARIPAIGAEEAQRLAAHLSRDLAAGQRRAERVARRTRVVAIPWRPGNAMGKSLPSTGYVAAVAPSVGGDLAGLALLGWV